MTEGPLVRIRRRCNVIGAWVAALILVGLCFLADPMGSFSVGGRLSAQSWEWAVGVLVAAVVALQLLASPVVEIRGTSCRVVKPVREWHFDIADVDGVESTMWGYPRIRFVNGSQVIVAALEETVFDDIRGAAPMTDRLAAATRAGPGTTPGDGPRLADSRLARPYWGTGVVMLAWPAYVSGVAIHGPGVAP